MKTLLQISREINVDKQRIYRYIKNYITDVDQIDGVIRVNDELESRIKKKLLIKKVDYDVHQTVSSDVVCNDLKRQLIVKDEQLKSKDEQIIMFQKLLENQQVLLKKEQDKNTLLLQTSSEKKTFLQKVFRK